MTVCKVIKTLDEYLLVTGFKSCICYKMVKSVTLLRSVAGILVSRVIIKSQVRNVMHGQRVSYQLFMNHSLYATTNDLEHSLD